MLHNLLVEKGVNISDEMRSGFPVKFTNPFGYVPDQLCVEAAEDVKRYLADQTDWHEEIAKGKMFGVLVVETPESKLGYLAAFSGNLQGRNNFEFFVPPVYDLLNPDEFFKIGEAEISSLNRKISSLESSTEYLDVVVGIDSLKAKYDEEVAYLKEVYREGKKKREMLRSVSDELMLEKLKKESQFQKAEIKRAERRYKESLVPLEEKFKGLKGCIEELKSLRKQKSADLQEEIFRKFSFLNGLGESADLKDIFREFYREQICRSGKDILPPAGAGECAAPKLLQYAFLHGMRPISMGEFWWGDSPRGEIRRHGEFYSSCKGKCAPILSFMLQGLPVEKPHFLPSENISKKLEILYEDKFILAVNKPSGILSVPGKQEDAKNFSAEVGPRVFWKSVPDFLAGFSGFEGGIFVVHRLDMHTSGVLLVAKTAEVYKQLQSQFAGRLVEKRYVAVLDGELSKRPQEGEISLPLSPDYEHRPAQVVDFENGKEAVTKYRVVKIKGGKTLVEFYPQTGRTHQLRVHSAHEQGLGMPIIGDLLYGRPDKRLMLHAEFVQFEHPVTGELLNISAPLPAEFEIV